MGSSAKFSVSLSVASKGSRVLSARSISSGTRLTTNSQSSDLRPLPRRNGRPARQVHSAGTREVGLAANLQVGTGSPEIACLHPGSPVPARASPLHPVASRRIPRADTRQPTSDWLRANIVRYICRSPMGQRTGEERRVGMERAPSVVEGTSQASPRSPVVRAGDGTAVEEGRNKSTLPAVGLLFGHRSSHHGIARDQNWGRMHRSHFLKPKESCDPCHLCPSKQHHTSRGAGSGQTLTCRGLWRKRNRKRKEKPEKETKLEKGEPR
jgi:hypothetical protein